MPGTSGEGALALAARNEGGWAENPKFLIPHS